MRPDKVVSVCLSASGGFQTTLHAVPFSKTTAGSEVKFGIEKEESLFISVIRFIKSWL